MKLPTLSAVTHIEQEEAGSRVRKQGVPVTSKGFEALLRERRITLPTRGHNQTKSPEPSDVAACIVAPSPMVNVASRALSARLMCAQPIMPERIERPVLQALGTDTPRLELRLHPAELGNLTICMTLKDNLVRLHLQTDTEDASKRLHAGMQALGKTLSKHGYILGEYTIRVNPKRAADKHKETQP